MKIQKAYFAAGSFWEVQASYEEIEGVLATRVGYMGGFMPYPKHQDVVKGFTGHAQTVEVLFNEDEVSYRELADYFFEIHNPTTLNCQGPDEGTAFRSVLFYLNLEQKTQALLAKDFFDAENIYHKPAVTHIRPVDKFYIAEEEHQYFVEKHPELLSFG